MTAHSLSRPLTVEPPTWPANDAPYFDCEVCYFESDQLDEAGRCPQCADLCDKDTDALVREIVELRDDAGFMKRKTAMLQREVADLRKLVCPDCRGTQVLTDDDSSPCWCEGGVR